MSNAYSDAAGERASGDQIRVGPELQKLEGMNLAAEARTAMRANTDSLVLGADEMAINACAMKMEYLKGSAERSNITAMASAERAFKRDLANVHLPSGRGQNSKSGSAHLSKANIPCAIAEGQKLSQMTQSVISILPIA
jgi:hypothetical protein